MCMSVFLFNHYRWRSSLVEGNGVEATATRMSVGKSKKYIFSMHHYHLHRFKILYYLRAATRHAHATTRSHSLTHICMHTLYCVFLFVILNTGVSVYLN